MCKRERERQSPDDLVKGGLKCESITGGGSNRGAFFNNSCSCYARVGWLGLDAAACRGSKQGTLDSGGAYLYILSPQCLVLISKQLRKGRGGAAPKPSNSSERMDFGFETIPHDETKNRKGLYYIYLLEREEKKACRKVCFLFLFGFFGGGGVN